MPNVEKVGSNAFRVTDFTDEVPKRVYIISFIDDQAQVTSRNGHDPNEQIDNIAIAAVKTALIRNTGLL